MDGYSDLKARVIVKRGSTVISEFRDAEFVGVTAGQSYTFDASPYLKDATAYTVQVEAQATYQDGTLMKTATAKVTMVAMELETTYSAGNGLADGGYKNDVEHPLYCQGHERGEEHLLPRERRTGLYPRSFGRQRCAAEERDHPPDTDAGGYERGGSSLASY